MQNLKNDSICLAITTWSSNAIINPLMLVVDKAWNDVVDIDDVPKIESKKLVKNGESWKKLKGVDKWFEKDKGKGKEVKTILKTIRWTPPPFS